MRFPIWQVDAFTDRLFAGNPAAVCLLAEFPDDERMLAVARENNLSETAFLVRVGDGRYRLRWFTPQVEVPLCGHATLASGFVVMDLLGTGLREVAFETRSGPVSVERDESDDDLLVLDFPAQPVSPCAAPAELARALGCEPVEVHANERAYLVVLGDEAAVRALAPDFQALERLDRGYVMATARGREADFVSRFFAPAVGVPEDPVTGAAHCSLAPFWAARLGRDDLVAHQVSRRGGELRCGVRGDRVRIGGRAVLYLEGFAHA